MYAFGYFSPVREVMPRTVSSRPVTKWKQAEHSPPPTKSAGYGPGKKL